MSESMQPIDATGASVEEAIESGLAKLGLSRNEVIIEIVEEGSRGVLGMGARAAVVRLTPLRQPSPSSFPSSPSVSPEQAKLEAEEARQILEHILASMSIKASVELYPATPASPEEAAPWVLDIRGPDLGILIGRKGETLDALQYIVRLIASKRLGHQANIVLDVESYKSRRETSLRKLALRMAEEARRLGRTVTLEPMPPNERRIIHLALRDDETVTTESVGMGERRKVTIIPNRSTR